MVNTRTTNYDKEQDYKVNVNEFEDDINSDTSHESDDSDSDYVLSDTESVYSCDNNEYNAAKGLIALKKGKPQCNKSDSDSDYEPENESEDDDECVGGIRNLRGMPKPCGVHIRFD